MLLQVDYSKHHLAHASSTFKSPLVWSQVLKEPSKLVHPFLCHVPEACHDHVQHLTAAYALCTTSFSLSIYPLAGELPGTAQCLSTSMWASAFCNHSFLHISITFNVFSLLFISPLLFTVDDTKELCKLFTDHCVPGTFHAFILYILIDSYQIPIVILLLLCNSILY